jgi:hypothetical protein
MTPMNPLCRQKSTKININLADVSSNRGESTQETKNVGDPNSARYKAPGEDTDDERVEK